MTIISVPAAPKAVNPILAAVKAYETSAIASDNAEGAISESIRVFVKSGRLSSEGAAFVREASDYLNEAHSMLAAPARAVIRKVCLRQPMERATGDKLTVDVKGNVVAKKHRAPKPEGEAAADVAEGDSLSEALALVTAAIAAGEQRAIVACGEAIRAHLTNNAKVPA